MTARAAFAALLLASCATFCAARDSRATAQPVSMGVHASFFQPPGTTITTLQYGIYVQWMFDDHWSAMVEVLYANWLQNGVAHKWTTIPASAIYQFLPGRPFNPYGLAGLNYTHETAGSAGSYSVGAHVGAGTVVQLQGFGFSIEGRYVMPDLERPKRGYMTWGGGVSLGFGLSL